MKTTANDSRFTAELSKLSAEQNKRLTAFSATKFTKSDSTAKPPFDERVRDVVLKYASDAHQLISEVNYLDSMHYGCVFFNGPLEEQILRFGDDPKSGEVHVKPFRWNKNYKRARKRVEKLVIPNAKLDVHEYKSASDIVDSLPKLDTHAGFEYIKTGKKYKGDYKEEMFDQFKQELAMAKIKGSFCKPILPGFRLQVSGAYDQGLRTGKFKRKVRLVSMVDIWQILAELMFSGPIQYLIGKADYYAGGKNPNELHSLVTTSRSQSRFWLSLDYSHYDQSLPSWLIEDAFDILWKCFNPSASNKSWKWLWDIIVNDFIHKAFVGRDGKLCYAHDGVPSGSMFTQIIDTICNLLMITTYFEHLSEGLSFKSIICGDDNLIYTNFEVDSEDVASYIKHCFGITCNADKCSHGTKGEDPEFLSRVWRTNGAWREPLELWSKLCYPERRRPYHREPQLQPELIVYSYILAYPLGMRDLMDVDKFMRDNVRYMKSWNKSVLDYQSGFLSYLMRYEKLAA